MHRAIWLVLFLFFVDALDWPWSKGGPSTSTLGASGEPGSPKGGRPPEKNCPSFVKICSFWHKTNTKFWSHVICSIRLKKKFVEGQRDQTSGWAACPGPAVEPPIPWIVSTIASVLKCNLLHCLAAFDQPTTAVNARLVYYSWVSRFYSHV